MTGVTTKAPARSPSHQVVQIAPKPGQAANPPRLRESTPMVALTGVARAVTMMANLPTPVWLSNALTPPAQRLRHHAPHKASRVLPMAMAVEVSGVPAVARLAAKAPARMAGQTRAPRSRTIASAKPAGGQIGVALGLIEANRRLSLARAR